jgi:hypothetical protein
MDPYREEMASKENLHVHKSVGLQMIIKQALDWYRDDGKLKPILTSEVYRAAAFPASPSLILVRPLKSASTSEHLRIFGQASSDP